jgi:Glycosyltransferase family 87
LEAYRAGAERLIQTGSPYHPALHAGPIDNVISNVPIAYLYPPPLAQVLVLFEDVPPGPLAIASSLVQVAVLSIVLPLVYRQFAGRICARSLLAVLVLAVFSFPLEFATYGGNLSGWTTIAVALMLVRPGGTAGVPAALIGFVKMTPLVLLVPVIAYPRSRVPAMSVLVGLAAISIAIAPTRGLTG